MAAQVSFLKDGSHWCVTCATRSFPYPPWTASDGKDTYCAVCVTRLLDIDEMDMRPHPQSRGAQLISLPDGLEAPGRVSAPTREMLAGLDADARRIMLSALREPALAHVHAQSYQHDTAWVVANTPGLLALRAAIDTALSRGQGAADVMCDDGEGYETVIIRQDEPWAAAGSPWGRAALPYIDHEFCPPAPDGVWPWELLDDAT